MKPHFNLIQGDSLAELLRLPTESIDCCITSPPYWGLRDYGISGQLGGESTLTEYLGKMVAIFNEVNRVLKKEGTLWLNMGDTYAHKGGCHGESPVGKRRGRETDRTRQAELKNRIPAGLKTKDLCGVPWRVAFALQAEGWFLRSDIIWHKPNPLPESVRDRPIKSHEYFFLLSKSKKYFYDYQAIREPAKTKPHKSGWKKQPLTPAGLSSNRDPKHADRVLATDGKRNKRDVWSVPVKPYKGAHFATFPPKLIEPAVLAGCPIGGTILDPFSGAGTTGLVALANGRNYLGIELNPEYNDLARARLAA